MAGAKSKGRHHSRPNTERMCKMVYRWKQERFPISAQAAGEELERIERECGQITPQSVLDESGDDDAVLHGLFEWDDLSAANEYRLVQAREIIRHIVVVEISGQKMPEPVRAFVHIEDSYKPVERVVSTSVYTDVMLRDALREASAFKRKYQALEQLAGVIRSIEVFEGEFDPDDAA